jgi:chromosome segregation ATPase
MDNAAKDKTYKSPARKLVRFFEKSRDQWKSKHHKAKASVKRLNNRVRFLEKSKGQWKNRVQELEMEVARLKAREQALEQAVESLGKKESTLRPDQGRL